MLQYNSFLRGINMLKVGCSDVESYAFYKQYIRSKKNNVKFNQLSKEEQEE